MKIKIKSFNGELPEYLSINDVYSYKPSSFLSYAGTITLLDEKKVFVHLTNCSCLNGGSWEVVND